MERNRRKLCAEGCRWRLRGIRFTRRGTHAVGCWCGSLAGWAHKRRPRTSCRRRSIAAYQQLAELRSPERFGAWLCSIADNKSAHVAAAPDHATQFSGSARLSRHRPSRRSRRSGRWCGRAIGRLSAPHRDVIVHHYLKGYSYQQTANLAAPPNRRGKEPSAKGPQTPAKGDHSHGGIQYCTDIQTRPGRSGRTASRSSLHERRPQAAHYALRLSSTLAAE